MCKTAGDQELLFVLLRKKLPVISSICRAVCPQIYGDIKDFTFDYPYELRLRVLLLEVQATENPLFAHGLIDLDDHNIDTGLHHIAS